MVLHPTQWASARPCPREPVLQLAPLIETNNDVDAPLATTMVTKRSLKHLVLETALNCDAFTHGPAKHVAQSMTLFSRESTQTL